VVGTNDPAIFVMGADGGNRRQLYNSPAYEWGARWSADGDQVVFTLEVDDFSYIYLMNADGSNVMNLAPRGSYPAWVR
jgi:Tol biopolymer transport system component